MSLVQRRAATVAAVVSLSVIASRASAQLARQRANATRRATRRRDAVRARHGVPRADQTVRRRRGGRVSIAASGRAFCQRALRHHEDRGGSDPQGGRISRGFGAEHGRSHGVGRTLRASTSSTARRRRRGRATRCSSICSSSSRPARRCSRSRCRPSMARMSARRPSRLSGISARRSSRWPPTRLALPGCAAGSTTTRRRRRDWESLRIRMRRSRASVC